MSSPLENHSPRETPAVIGRTALVIFLLFIAACTAPAIPATELAPVPPPSAAPVVAPESPALAFFEDPMGTWPLLRPGVESRYFSSFDRRGGNDDGFNGTYSTLYALPTGEHVIFDARGPGVLNTLWFTGPEEGGAGLELGAIKFYFDDEATPRLVTTVEQLFAGHTPPFRAPFVYHNRQSSGGFVSWLPLPYQRRLIITTERQPAFYIAQYDTHPADAPIQSWHEGLSYERARAALTVARCEDLSASALKDVPLHHQQQGPGLIQAIRFQPRGATSEAQLSQARITIRFEGQQEPSVDVPLGMFFGSGLGEAKVRALAFQMREGCYINRFPMPFWRGFELEITGLAGRLSLALAPNPFSRAEAGTFHARYQKAFPTAVGSDFQWLRWTGTGKLVGTLLTIYPPTPQTKRWWEGDLRTYLDGKRTPSLHGTGHEDDHLGGWSNTFFERPFSLPLHGEPKTKIIEHQGEQYNAQITLYRLWPGISFGSSIVHSVEHGSRNRVTANYAGVAFFYAQTGGPRLVQTDWLDLGDVASRQQHRFEVKGQVSSEPLISTFEGRWDQRPVEQRVLSHVGPARFRMTITPDNQGCLLRKMYDQQHPRQHARLRVDGNDVTQWYLVEGNPTLRWAERELFIPEARTRRRKELSIEILPQGEAPPWSAAEYRVLCFTPWRGQ